MFCVTGLETSTLGACAPSLGSNRFPGSVGRTGFLEPAETLVEAVAGLQSLTVDLEASAVVAVANTVDFDFEQTIVFGTALTAVSDLGQNEGHWGFVWNDNISRCAPFSHTQNIVWVFEVRWHCNVSVVD